MFDVLDWYWLVGGDTSRVWSSAAEDFVPLGDAAYQAFLARGNRTSATPALADLQTLLIQHRIAALEAQQTPRRMREALAGTDEGWMEALEEQIAALRAQLLS